MAQEYKPWPRAQITSDQWQSYFDQVQINFGATERKFPEEHLAIFENTTQYITWVFTTPGHSAHPAWVTRQAVQDGKGVSIRQIGYFAGDEAAFAKMFRGYLALNDQMRDEFEKRKAVK